ncbi:UDP-N-acetylmuramate dehydrogenase [Catenovulum maritimum]|uniref:UDP-N-acetylenolpyruvoylglucosamine reductase n=1 Tax=Catenovulum maritimum TaxID=1513271 RepID=A0A0J8GS60_9ALTE|nr:UDP-N-acetylmuramate dehydrogenase [Catenovulum maritimum]KMT65557.1 hypothetical protein XM47_07575 [Catenovulum maritimum]
MTAYSINNTFAVDADASQLILWPEQAHLFDREKAFLIAGSGSNLLFVDSCFDGQVILSGNQTFRLSETSEHYVVELGAGLNWHQTIIRLLDLGIYGLENLALIPGTVGAAPVQNIGAYGVEFSDFCYQVDVIDLSATEKQTSCDGTAFTLSNEECQFGYRDSVFKHKLKQRYLIHQVTLHLTKNWQANLNYAPLNQLNLDASAKQIFDLVCQVRTQKLPDPNEIPNAGSFFKNPIISTAEAEKLKQSDPNLPVYPILDSDQVKVAAGYLIDKTGLKGFQLGQAAIHDKQALVIVNNAKADGKQIAELAKYVRLQVFQQYGIWLEPEVRFIRAQGEVDAVAFLDALDY